MIYEDILEFYQAALRIFGRSSTYGLVTTTRRCPFFCIMLRNIVLANGSDLTDHNVGAIISSHMENFQIPVQHILEDLQRHKRLIESQANVFEIQTA